MFGFKQAAQEEKVTVKALQEELHRCRQEREAARLGLVGAVQRLLNEAQAIPLDEHVEMVAKDLAGVGRDEDARS